MASHVFVVDSSFKRTQIKATPGKYLREILEEACKSRKLSPEEYTLKTQNNKTVDLSQPFRLSGLTAGAKLQLTQASKSPGVVSVALQLPESEGGGRLSDKFPSTTSIWLILRKYEDAVAGSQAQKLNLTQRAVASGDSGQGRLMYEQPSLNVLGRTLENLADLQKTLAQLGLNGGSALMRLTFKTTECPLEEAMQEISTHFNSVEPAPAAAASNASQPPQAAPADGNTEAAPDGAADTPNVPSEVDAKQQPSDDTPMSDGLSAQPVQDDNPATSSEGPAGTTQSEPVPTPPPTSQPDEPPTSPSSNTINGISVYRPPSSSTPAAALAPDDPSVFEPTIDHAKAHQAALNRDSKNKRLLSDKELEAQETERQQRLSAIQSVTVRVRYPDQSQIETVVSSADTAADLYAKVMDTLAAAPEPFELRYLGSKTHETLPNASNKRLVKDFGFHGKVLVTLVWAPEASLRARQGPSLKDEYRRHAIDLKVELAGQQASGEEAHRTAMQRPEVSGGDGGGGGGSGKGKGDLESKMKKFLGFGKK